MLLTGNLAIQAPDLLFHVLDQASYRNSRPDHQRHPSPPGLVILAEGLVDGGIHRLVQPEMLHVARNTDDRHPLVWFVWPGPVNMDANWALSGKKLPHERLVDDYHPLLSFAVRRAEVASCADGNLHDAEVITHDR